MFKKASRPEPTNEPENQAEETAEEATEQPEAVIEAQPEEEAEDWKEKYQLLQDQFARLAADFDNYRKRVREEQETLAKYGAQKTVLELLPVLDNLDRAVGSLNEDSDSKVLFKSFSVLQKQLMDKLEGLNVKKIQSIGQTFDPQRHEAVNMMQSADFPENSIMYEAQSGYTLNDKVIRPAMVVVSTGNGEENADSCQVPAAEQNDKAEAQPNPFRK